MDPTIEMEQDFMEFGGEWSPSQTFVFGQSSDLKPEIRAHDGQFSFGAPSKTHLGHDLGQPAVDAPVLGTEWLDETTSLQQYLELIDVSDLVSLGDGLPEFAVEPEVIAPEVPSASPISSRPKPKHSELLQSMLTESNEVLSLLAQPSVVTAVQVEEPLQCSMLLEEISVKPEIELDSEEVVLECTSTVEIEDLTPLSPDDIDSLLSSTTNSPLTLSAPASPSLDSNSCSTVDSSSLYNCTIQSSELYKIVANDQPVGKHRATPYSRPEGSKGKGSKSNKGRKRTASIEPEPSEFELELMSKKDRKKLQNKNAAIRYRMRKKEESDQKRSEVDDLESINKELHDKAADLQRQIKYMKELINDVRKARGLPVLSK